MHSPSNSKCQFDPIFLPRSLRNKKWVLNYLGSQERAITDYFFSQREIEPKYSIKDYWPQPGEIPDLEKALEVFHACAKNNEKIAIVGDYDVDGTSSTSI